MSIINNSYRFIFVHVPKAAGTSVTAALSPLTNYCDLEIGGTAFGEAIQPAYQKRFELAKHSPAAAIRGLVGSVTWSRYFTFAFVRNPFDRSLSTYNFLRQWKGPGSDFYKRMCAFDSFDDYVLSDIWHSTDGPDLIFRPQVYWLRAQNSNQILTSFIGKVELLEKDLEQVLLNIDAPRHMVSALKRLNSSGPKPKVVSENPAVIEKILDKYRIDFESFGYDSAPKGLVPAAHAASGETNSSIT
jgi:hypothetical protein